MALQNFRGDWRGFHRSNALLRAFDLAKPAEIDWEHSTRPKAEDGRGFLKEATK